MTIELDRVFGEFREAFKQATPETRIVTTAFGQSLEIQGDTVQFDMGDFDFEEQGEFDARSAAQKNRQTPKGHLTGEIILTIYTQNEASLINLSSTVASVVRGLADSNENVFFQLNAITQLEKDDTREQSPCSRVIRVGISILTDSKWSIHHA